MPARLSTGLNSISNLKSVSALDAGLLPRHRWYHFKEGFSPELVSYAIQTDNCKEGDHIIDPFNGSGTVALTSTSSGFAATGFEVNPFLAFVARTKLLSSEPISLYGQKIKDAILTGAVSPLETFSTFSDGGKPKQKWLFNKAVLSAFEGGWLFTEDLSAAPRDLLRLCLINAAMDVCNAVKDGKCLRYKSAWKERKFGKNDFLRAFFKHLKQVNKDLIEDPLNSYNTRIHLGDSRDAMEVEANIDKFELCVTSPPYLNSFDYTDVYRPELFLGRFITNNKELEALRFKTLRSHIQVKWDDPVEKSFGKNFTESYSTILERREQLWGKRIPEMILAYFEDMKKVLTNLRTHASPNASVWIVVSTSAYVGVEIPVDLIIADIASQVGWYLREVSVARYLRRVPGQQWNQLAESKDNKPHLRESIIILDASTRRKKRARS